MITTLKEFLNENNSNDDTVLSVWNSEIGTILPESDIYVYVQKLHRDIDDFYDGDLGKRIERYKKYKLCLIPIEKIDTERFELYEDDVDDMMEKYKKNSNYPPIVLGKLKYGLYDIIDGNHRANVLKELGIDNIKAWIPSK